MPRPAPTLSHPGTIAVIDGNTGATLRTRPIAEVPEASRFVGRVPVVRVVMYQHGDRRIIQEQGPRGEVLRSTTQIRSGAGGA